MPNRLFTARYAIGAIALLAVCVILTAAFKTHEGGLRGALAEIGFVGLVVIVLAYAGAGVAMAVRSRRNSASS